MFASRSRRVDPHLEWKVRLFTVAAVMALAGMYFQERWMTGAAIVLLVGAIGLRFLGGGLSGEIDRAEDELDEDDLEDGAGPRP